MGVTDSFGVIFGRLQRDAGPHESLPVLLARTCAEVLDVDYAGLSLFTGAGLRVPIGTSHDDVDDVEQLQFTAGEGPGYQARKTAHTVCAVESMITTSWPVFHHQLVTRTPIRSITACPMTPPMTAMGTVDLYFRTKDASSSLSSDEIDEVVALVSMMLLDSLALPDVHHHPTTPGWVTVALRNRREVMAAIGLLNSALLLDGAQALAVLRSHAYTADISLQETAHQLVYKTLSVSELKYRSYS